MKIRYLLKTKKDAKKGSDHPIFLALYQGDETELIFTGERIMKSEWSKDERLPRDHNGQIYTRIEKVKADIQKIMRLMEAQEKIVSPYSLKRQYEESKKEKLENQQAKDKQDKTNAVSVSSLIDKWIKVGLGEWQPSTKKVVITSIKTFQTYLKISGQPKLECRDLTLEIINDYAAYLQDKRKLRDSSHGKKMKHLRWFLKWLKFDSTQIKEIKLRTVKPGERNIISLTLEELTDLENVDVSGHKEQQKAKDMFLLGCYTGLRISDLKRISRPRIDEAKKRLTMTLLKNRKLVTIPLMDEAFQILARYNWSAPKISEQQVNESIKEVCGKAHIDVVITFNSKKAGRLEETLHRKHELVTSHVAGKTFISLAAKRWGLTPVDIAAIVGKDVRTVMGHYLKPDQKEAIEKMEKAEAEKRKGEDERRSQMKAV